MSDSVTWEYQGWYGEIEFEWYGAAGGIFEKRPTASIRIEEPYRETYGHSANITPDAAREFAAKLIEFADLADAKYPVEASPAVGSDD